MSYDDGVTVPDALLTAIIRSLDPLEMLEPMSPARHRLHVIRVDMKAEEYWARFVAQKREFAEADTRTFFVKEAAR